jgi:hypothetical protein
VLKRLLNHLNQQFSTWGTRTSGGMREVLRGYAKRWQGISKLLKIPVFHLIKQKIKIALSLPLIVFVLFSEDNLDQIFWEGATFIWGYSTIID